MSLDPSLALQKAVRRRLTASPDLAALVPPSAIHDAWRRPEAPACIIRGEGQNVTEDGFFARNMIRVFLDLHVWTQGAAIAPAKAITGAIGAALAGQLPTLDAGQCIDFRTAHTRFLRDPGNEWAHAVVTLEALVDTGASAAVVPPSSTPAPAPVASFTFDNAAVWSIPHNLNRFPNIITVDTTGEQVEGDVFYLSANLVEVRFAIPVSGTAYLN